MITIVVAFLLIAFFFVFEGRIRRGQEAKALGRGDAMCIAVESQTDRVECCFERAG